METWDDNEVGGGKIIEGGASSPRAQNGFSEAKGSMVTMGYVCASKVRGKVI